VAKGELMPAIDMVIFSASLGEVRGPIDSPIGFHIIKLTEEDLGEHVHSFEEVRDEIATTLYASESIAWLDERAATVQGALDDGATLEEAAEKVGFPLAEATVEEGRGIQGLGDFPAVQDAVLAEPGTTSGAVNVFRGIAFIRVEEATEPAPLPLEEVRERVVRLVKDEQAEAAAQAAAEEIHAALSTGTPIAEAAEARGIEVQEAGPFAMGGSVGSLGQAHKLRHDVFETDEGAIGPVTEVSGAWVVYEVTERIEPEPFAIEEEREQIRDSMRSASFNQLYPAALERLQERYEVSVNQELVDYVTQSLAQPPSQPGGTPEGGEAPIPTGS
jgi:peptidyl-prolyl cis-trans isomerase D